MVIAILGSDGVGKSTVADALGAKYAENGVTIVVDTDLTRPTLPGRGLDDRDVLSLGSMLDGRALSSMKSYLIQDSKSSSLFYAGTITGETMLTYQQGTESAAAAHDTIKRFEQTGTVILDVSGQRSDPFFAAALMAPADRFVVMGTPDLRGIQWLLGVLPLFENFEIDPDRIIFLGARDRGGYVSEAEERIGAKFTAVIPEIKGRDIHDTSKFRKPLQKVFAALNAEPEQPIPDESASESDTAKDTEVQNSQTGASDTAVLDGHSESDVPQQSEETESEVLDSSDPAHTEEYESELLGPDEATEEESITIHVDAGEEPAVNTASTKSVSAQPSPPSDDNVPKQKPKAHRPDSRKQSGARQNGQQRQRQGQRSGGRSSRGGRPGNSGRPRNQGRKGGGQNGDR